MSNTATGLVPANEILEPNDLELVDARVRKDAIGHLEAWDGDQKVKAVHESGHAVIATVLGIKAKEIDIKGGRSGFTITGEDDDDRPMFQTRDQSRDRIIVSLAGYYAEVALIGQPTTGAAVDIEQATSTAVRHASAWLDGNLLLLVGGWAFGNTPEVVNTALAREVKEIIGAAALRCEHLVGEHVEQILALARIVYASRRLSDDALVAALRSVGLEPQA